MPEKLNLILDQNKLVGPNFKDWNMRIVLRYEKLSDVLNQPVMKPPAEGCDPEVTGAWNTWLERDNEVQCIMLVSMNNELQKHYENFHVVEIVDNLKVVYGEYTQNESYEISKALFRMKMTEGTSVSDYVLKMITYIEQLENMGMTMDSKLINNLVLQSLPDSFSPFVLNFHMYKMNMELHELHKMLQTAERSIKKKKACFASWRNQFFQEGQRQA
ncbi:hypothetical protein Dimus_038359 [Dionaea muscipula]